MRGAGRVNGQAFGVSDVCQMREKLQRINEFLSGCNAALNSKSQNRAWPLGRIFLSAIVLVAGLQPWVGHPGNLRMGRQEFRRALRIGDMPLHAQRKGL